MVVGSVELTPAVCPRLLYPRPRGPFALRKKDHTHISVLKETHTHIFVLGPRKHPVRH